MDTNNNVVKAGGSAGWRGAKERGAGEGKWETSLTLPTIKEKTLAGNI